MFSNYKEKIQLIVLHGHADLGFITESGFLLSIVLLVQFLDLALASQVMMTL